MSAADSFTAILLAAIVLFAGVRALYRRTIDSRRNTRRRLDSLVIGNPTAYVDQLFGTPALVELHSARESLESDRGGITVEFRLYDASHGWLTAHIVDDGLVGYGFTLTDHRFRYDLTRKSFSVLNGTLGRQSFAAVIDNEGDVTPYAGASVITYAEIHYVGRPGYYHTFGLAQTMLGLGGSDPAIDTLMLRGQLQYDRVRNFRRHSVPNTFSVRGPEYPIIEDDEYLRTNVILDDKLVRFFPVGPKGWATSRDRQSAAGPARHL